MVSQEKSPAGPIYRQTDRRASERSEQRARFSRDKKISAGAHLAWPRPWPGRGRPPASGHTNIASCGGTDRVTEGGEGTRQKGSRRSANRSDHATAKERRIASPGAIVFFSRCQLIGHYLGILRPPASHESLEIHCPTNYPLVRSLPPPRQSVPFVFSRSLRQVYNLIGWSIELGVYIVGFFIQSG